MYNTEYGTNNFLLLSLCHNIKETDYSKWKCCHHLLTYMLLEIWIIVLKSIGMNSIPLLSCVPSSTSHFCHLLTRRNKTDWQDFTVCNTGLIFTKTDLIIWKMISEQHVLYFLLTLLGTFLSIKVNHDVQTLYWMYPIGHQFSYLIFCRSKKLKNKEVWHMSQNFYFE